jgi:hypothetical protein
MSSNVIFQRDLCVLPITTEETEDWMTTFQLLRNLIVPWCSHVIKVYYHNDSTTFLTSLRTTVNALQEM